MAMSGGTNRPLLLVLIHQNFIVSSSLERLPYFCPGRLPHLIQGYVMGGVRFDNPNAIKHPNRIRIVLVDVSVPIFPVLAVIVIVLLAIISPAPVLFFLW